MVWSPVDIISEEIQRLERHSDELLAQCAVQDDRALAVLLRRYKPLVLIKIAPLRGNARDEALLAAWEGLLWAVRRYDEADGRSFGEWAALCLNECVANVEVDSEEAIGTEVADTTMGPAEADDPEIDGEDDLLANLPQAVRGNLWDALSSLEREVFVRYNKGNSYQEIADALKRPLKSIDNALYRIKCKLEAAVQRHGHEKKAKNN